MYMLLGSNRWSTGHSRKLLVQYWAVGRQLPGQRFEKVSVVVMDDEEEVKRLEGLGIVNTKSHYILV